MALILTDRLPFPSEFTERFNRIVPEAHRQIIQQTFDSNPHSICVRINTLLTDAQTMKNSLRERNIEFSDSGICEEVICIQNQSMKTFRDEPIVRDGLLYPLKMASAIPVVELNPQPGERIMDLCAAPGGKTIHIAARMKGEGFLFAVEPVRDRFFKLRANCERTGVKNAVFKQADGRMIRPDREGFDKVLVDAPCSSESRFESAEPKTYAYWSLRKIKEMRKKQIGLIRSGLRCLKPGGILVYSTCTFAPEENESVIQYIQRKFENEIELLPVETGKEFQYPILTGWDGKKINVILSESEESENLGQEVRPIGMARYAFPQDGSAFFVAKFRKK